MELKIDGKWYSAREGQSVLEAALDAGVYIPHLCSHPLLEAQGGCKLCAVEIEGRTGTALSCMMPAEEGMAVFTATEAVRHLRQVALELMLAGHPSDCTSCAVYLNCELQNLMQYLGVAHSRLRLIEKRNARLASGPANPLIKREMERCIQCGRCVRACGGLRGVGALEYRERGGESYVGVKGDAALAESDCRFCGACAEVCPTGAIQDMPGVFPADAPRTQALVPCRHACPAHVDISEYIRLSGQGRYAEAVSVIREKLTFPHALALACNRVCEEKCKRSYLDQALSIRGVKRRAIENDRRRLWQSRVVKGPASGRAVAVIGAGPSGLTAAWHLARKGHTVTVFEKESLPGGLMRYGIPPYRLPAEVVDEEIAILKDIGIEICTNVDVVSVKTVKDAFDAVLVAAGASRGITPFGPGEEPDNVFSALDFLKRACAGVLPEPGGMVTVVGGGNVAFDCARTSAKAGAGAVRVLCLEGRDKMLADEEEVEAALGEGVMIMNGMLATGAHAEGSLVSEVSAIAVKSFSFGLSGLEYEAEAGSEAVFLTDTLIYAMGQRVGLPEGFGLERGRGGAVVTGENCMTEMEGVFAAGDVVTGTKSLVEAVASGTCAASGIDLFLGGDGDVGLTLFDRDAPVADIGVIEGFSKIPRCEGVVDEADARREASRCLQCDLRLSIPRVKYWGDEVYRAGMRQEGREPGGDAEESLAGLPGKTSGKAGAGGKTAGGKAGGKEGAGGKTAAEEDAIRLCGKVYGDLCQPDYRDGADCPVDWSLGLMEKLARGSCGRDTLCRDGGRETANILADIAGGRGVDGDMELLGELLSAMRTGANCDMGREAAGQVLCLLDGHEDKWRQHISRKRCPDLACKALVSLHIDPEKCTGCGSCMGACEAGAIAGGAGLIHVIDRQACTKCMKCSGACPEDAVVKTTTGAIVRVPEAPVPAGGFAGSGEGRRRRRKGI